ncbi:CRISPR-associated endonuclease Cas2 [Chondromyces crocatus]|uniref:CRISPR-associated endonuclease Cas2 n=1 Tax=Chondromyces crocatus TaxID=52 RepID=UPI0014701937|nr:CRISPR-associated endonuclease Cas2 [Chondromyces crocatus]
MNDRPRKPWKAERPGAALGRSEPGPAHLLAIFDVSDDRARRKLTELCKDYGLTRFQWSAFEGQLTRNRREELFDRGKRLLDDAVGGGRFFIVGIGAREQAESLRLDTPGRPAPAPKEGP